MLRPYTRRDLEAIVELDRQCFEAAFRFSPRSMRRFAEGPRARAILSENEQGSIDGFVIVEITGGRADLHGYCITLDVAPGARRSGLGRHLLEAAEAWVASQAVDSLRLHVWVGNPGAIHFYERLGYICDGLIEGFYGADGMDALIYSKRL